MASSLRCSDFLSTALGELRLGLRDADLVHLKPGEQLLQQSSWVLLKGTLKTKGLAAKVPAGMPGKPGSTLSPVGTFSYPDPYCFGTLDRGSCLNTVSHEARFCICSSITGSCPTCMLKWLVMVACRSDMEDLIDL